MIHYPENIGQANTEAHGPGRKRRDDPAPLLARKQQVRHQLSKAGVPEERVVALALGNAMPESGLEREFIELSKRGQKREIW